MPFAPDCHGSPRRARIYRAPPRAAALCDRPPVRDSREPVTPATALLFLGAAIALEQGVVRDSSALFAVGIACLALSLGAPLLSLLRAGSRPRRRITTARTAERHELPP